MNRERYEAYSALRDAAADEDGSPSAVLQDLAESLLLARDTVEAEDARDRARDGLAQLVERGELTRRAASRFWAQMRACGPPMYWPPSWDREVIGSPSWAVRGH